MPRIPFGQPVSEEDWDDEASLNVTIDNSGYYLEPKADPFYSMMEVSSVIISNFPWKQLYGNIKINYDCVTHVLFSREKPSDDITIFQNERFQMELLLTNPAAHSILMDADRVEVAMEFTSDVNNKTYRCIVPFSKFDHGREYTYYDRLISATMSHKALGLITINYRVFQDAVAAKVEVLLLDTNISIDDVYGSIYAYSSTHDLESCLFHKTKKTDGMCVTPDNGRHIPLSRSIVAVPYYAELMFSLDLTDSKTGLSIAEVDDLSLIVPPKLLEPHQTKKDYSVRIPQSLDVCSKIQINVTWAMCFVTD